MKILSAPISQSFVLESDPDGIAEIVVNQATEGENIERAQLFSKTRYVQTEAFETAAEQDVNPRRLHRKEAYLTLGRVTGLEMAVTNAKGEPVIDKETGDPKVVELFRSKASTDGERVRDAMSETEFNRAWDRLPKAMVNEIVRRVLEVNFDWDPDHVPN